MKNFLYMIASLFLLVNRNNPQSVPQESIEIRHTGPQEALFKQSFFIKKKLEFETIERYFKEIEIEPDTLPKKVKVDIWNGLYTTIVTDSKTFSTIVAFVGQHQTFFTNNTDNKYTDYAIIVNGKTHHIIFKLQRKFFRDLPSYLRKENCDVMVIKDINSYY